VTREDVEKLVKNGKWIFPGAGHVREDQPMQKDNKLGSALVKFAAICVVIWILGAAEKYLMVGGILLGYFLWYVVLPVVAYSRSYSRLYRSLGKFTD
jgi:hypothetical protein